MGVGVDEPLKCIPCGGKIAEVCMQIAQQTPAFMQGRVLSESLPQQFRGALQTTLDAIGSRQIEHGMGKVRCGGQHCFEHADSLGVSALCQQRQSQYSPAVDLSRPAPLDFSQFAFGRNRLAALENSERAYVGVLKSNSELLLLHKDQSISKTIFGECDTMF